MTREYLKKATLTATSGASDVHETVKGILDDIEAGGDAKASLFGVVPIDLGHANLDEFRMPQKITGGVGEIIENPVISNSTPFCIPITLNFSPISPGRVRVLTCWTYCSRCTSFRSCCSSISTTWPKPGGSTRRPASWPRTRRTWTRVWPGSARRLRPNQAVVVPSVITRSY